MNAEILCVGTEILLGDIVNTNAAYIARELAGYGIGCYYQTVVGDNPERLKLCLKQALDRSDMVITTGGLGPTYDDLTKETVGAYFGREMYMHEPSLQQLRDFYKRIDRPMTPNNEKQAQMPEDAIVFYNDRGTAPGLAVEGDGKIVIMLPGPPREMTAMFQKQVKPYLMKLSDHTLVSHNIHLFGIGESNIAHELRDMMESNTNPTIAPYAKEGEVLLRVTAAADTAEAADKLMQPVIKEICDSYARYVYGIDVDTLENALVWELSGKNMTVAFAESCTGGFVAKRVTDIPGASKVFHCGVCTYSNDMKMHVLGVSKETLDTYTDISAETAREMAKGVRELGGADIGISVTGLAGPGGGTGEKPVGLVYVGISTKDGEEAQELMLSRGYGGNRAFIRNLAASNALYLALRKAQQQ